jgi:hypothetical protein
MFRLGLPERSCRRNFGHNLAGPQAGCFYISNSVFRDLPLALAAVKNGGPITGSSIIPLTIKRSWVMNLKKEF